MPALFHNQEFSMRSDKSAQMFYGEEGAADTWVDGKIPEKRGGETEQEMGLN
jgi:hypothetical protein